MTNNKNTPEQGLKAQNKVGETSDFENESQNTNNKKNIPLLAIVFLGLGFGYAHSDLPFVGDLYQRGGGFGGLIQLLYFNDSAVDMFIGLVVKAVISFFLFIPLFTSLRLLNCMSTGFHTINSDKWVVRAFHWFSNIRFISPLLDFARKIDNGKGKDWGRVKKIAAWVYRKKSKTGYTSLLACVAVVFAVIYKWKVATEAELCTKWGAFSVGLAFGVLLVGYLSKRHECYFQKAKVDLKDQSMALWGIIFMFVLSITATFFSMTFVVLGLLDFLNKVPAICDFIF